jgi:DNA-directed RNA polymerase subunit M/transcription elongation factor TFIIS
MITKETYELNPKFCKNCGKELPFNKIRNIYCNRSCSVTFTNLGKIKSEATKIKISETLKSSESAKEGNLNRKRKLKNAFIFECLHCKDEGLSYRNSKQLYHPDCWKLASGGLRKGSGRGKKGWYKGFFCDSSWELAFVIYHIDKGINIERNKVGLEYEYKSKLRKYYPDFIINDKYYEIKGRRCYSDLDEQTKLKVDIFSEVKILYTVDMKIYLSYVINKYGNNFISMYE